MFFVIFIFRMLIIDKSSSNNDDQGRNLSCNDLIQFSFAIDTLQFDLFLLFFLTNLLLYRKLEIKRC